MTLSDPYFCNLLIVRLRLLFFFLIEKWHDLNDYAHLHTKMHLCVAVTKDNFCTRYAAACDSINGAGPWSSCDTEFRALQAGSGTDNANTQACRMHHLKLTESGASGGAKVHCPHASKAGTGGCDDLGTYFA